MCVTVREHITTQNGHILRVPQLYIVDVSHTDRRDLDPKELLFAELEHLLPGGVERRREEDTCSSWELDRGEAVA